MATPNVGILTTAGKALIDKVNSGQAKISFSKIVFSSMDNSQLSDMQVKALTAIAPQEVVVSSPETTLDTNSGETRIRATGTNEKLADGVYVKTYGVFAKDDTGSEILYGVTVSPNPNYFPAYDGVTPQAVTYSYKTVIQETSNITMTNSNDVYASQEDLTEALQPYAKTVDVNQQLDKKVNIADMRKPASDVAGIEEVNAKQDKIGYTPADDSKVVHTTDTSNWQKQKITYDDGSNKYSFTTANTTDLVAAIQALPLGYHTFYCQSGVQGNPSSQSVRGIAYITTAGANPLGVGYLTDSTGTFWSFYVDKNGFRLQQSADDSKVVHSTDMRKPASDVAGIEEVSAKQDKIGYTPADDSKVVHDNHDGTITADGTVFNLLSSLSASSIPQDPTKDYNTLPQGLALMSELNGEPANMPPVKSTYLTLTIASNFVGGRKRQLAWLDAGASSSNNNYTYIRYCVGSTWSSWDSIPTSTQISSLIPSTIADTTKDANFTGKLQKSGIDVATKSDVTTAVSDVARTSQQTNFTAGLQSGGVDVATAADLKSIEASAWRVLDFKNIVNDQGVTPSIDNASVFLYKLDETNKRIYMLFTLFGTFPATSNLYFNFSNVVKNISFPTFKKYGFYINIPGYNSYTANDIKNNKLHISIADATGEISSLESEYIDNAWHHSPCFINYDELV
ncbi:hypothetical protein [Levilactobacillus brevis]|uniref:hypothetical protein n=1 Tax=Levilactobacillus brevis TaxID=1580 RepID=UPI0009489456|nr:hypothetical protein [Levilactobacillus brevis]